MGDDDHRRRCPNEDRLSSLPDELLLLILLRLGSTCAAARTSVLSRRWRHVWADLPELVLVRGPDAPPSSFPFHDTVDAALDAHATPTLQRLLICDSDSSEAISSGRAAPWLRFAAERVAGAILLLVPPRLSSLAPVAVQELELPACARAKTVTLKLQDTWFLRPAPAGGVFTALTALTILYGRMEGGELTALVSTRCPCLKDLRLRLTLVDASDVSICSETLRSLWFCILNSPLIEVVAPRLEKMWVYYAFMARFAVPKLSELVWTGDYTNESHQFVNISHSLQRLDIARDHRLVPTSLLEKFSQVDELNLIICIPRGITGYESFLSETSKLPKCRTLNISLEPKGHGLAPCILHFLRNCSGVKKVSVRLLNFDDDSQYSCPVSCSCRLAESRRIDDVVLSSLEEVKLSSCTSSHEELEFVELLSKCDATNLKHLVIDYYKKKFQAPVESKEICKKICSMFGPNVEVEFYVVGQGRRVCFNWSLVKNVSRKMVTTT